MGDASELQWIIDNLDYPPTHQFLVSSLKPIGVLQERLDKIFSLFPEFAKSKSFLDIGANKGYFSRLQLENGAKVVAIEPDEQFHGSLPVENLNFRLFKKSFREFIPDTFFDLIWIGNAHHYLEYESPNYAWLKKLAACNTGFLIIEGPADDCPDVPRAERWRFNLVELEKHIAGIYELSGHCDSPQYTPNRKIYLLRRINLPKVLELSLEGKARIERSAAEISLYKDDNYIYKIIGTEIPEKRQIAIQLANLNVTNGTKIEKWIVDSKNQIIGWSEKINTSSWNDLQQQLGNIPYIHKKSRAIREIIVQNIARNSELTLQGYIDIDFGIDNWFYDRKTNTYYSSDKNSVRDLETLTNAELQNFMTVLENNFGPVNQKQKSNIVGALAKRNSIGALEAIKLINNMLLPLEQNFIKKINRNREYYLSKMKAILRNSPRYDFYISIYRKIIVRKSKQEN